jgi:hypothetical protein
MKKMCSSQSLWGTAAGGAAAPHEVGGGLDTTTVSVGKSALSIPGVLKMRRPVISG